MMPKWWHCVLILTCDDVVMTYLCFIFCHRYRDYNSGYAGGYGNQGYSGNFQLGAKRKSDLGDFGGSPKKPYGMRGNATIRHCVNPISV